MFQFFLGLIVLVLVNTVIGLTFDVNPTLLLAWGFISGILYPRLYAKYLA